jgi:hypothetical protein
MFVVERGKRCVDAPGEEPGDTLAKGPGRSSTTGKAIAGPKNKHTPRFASDEP